MSLNSSISNSEVLISRSPLDRQLFRLGAACLLGVAPFLCLEFWARTALFHDASYTSSEPLDGAWKAFNSRRDWTVLYVGDSEVRWGFDPAQIDTELTALGLESRGFNMAIDGFSGGLYRTIVPYLEFSSRAPAVRVAIIGTQLIEYHSFNPAGGVDCSGALQAPIFKSPFAKDLSLDRVCRDHKHVDGPLLAMVEEISKAVRYRQSIREALLRHIVGARDMIRFDSGALRQHDTGFHPHKSIAQHRRNYDQGLAALEKDRSSAPRAFSPIDSEQWRQALKHGGYFDAWADYFLQQGVLPVFVALPTNPLLIDLKQRRQNYIENGAALSEWAAQKGAVFIDLGIQDGLEPETTFADHRHLSAAGAAVFSSKLASALSENPNVRRALER